MARYGTNGDSLEFFAENGSQLSVIKVISNPRNVSDMRRVILVLIEILIFTFLFVACTKPLEALSVAQLLDFGEKYLMEMNYEQAIVYFTRAIEVEPMNPRGYAGAAEGYIGLTKMDKALEIVHQGYESTGDKALSTLLETLQAELLGSMTTPIVSQPDSNATSMPMSGNSAPPNQDQFAATVAQSNMLDNLISGIIAWDYERVFSICESDDFEEFIMNLADAKHAEPALSYEHHQNGEVLRVAYSKSSESVQMHYGSYEIGSCVTVFHDFAPVGRLHSMYITQQKNRRGNGPYKTIVVNDYMKSLHIEIGYAVEGFLHGDVFYESFSPTDDLHILTMSTFDYGIVQPIEQGGKIYSRIKIDGIAGSIAHNSDMLYESDSFVDDINMTLHNNYLSQEEMEKEREHLLSETR